MESIKSYNHDRLQKKGGKPVSIQPPRRILSNAPGRGEATRSIGPVAIVMLFQSMNRIRNQPEEPCLPLGWCLIVSKP